MRRGEGGGRMLNEFVIFCSSGIHERASLIRQHPSISIGPPRRLRNASVRTLSRFLAGLTRLGHSLHLCVRFDAVSFSTARRWRRYSPAVRAWTAQSSHSSSEKKSPFTAQSLSLVVALVVHGIRRRSARTATRARGSLGS